MARQYKILFEVRPRNKLPHAFPIDMLRYDVCGPRSESDSNKIAHTIEGSSPSTDTPEAITLLRYGLTDKTWSPTVGRWESFGWEVVPNSIRVE